MSEGNLIPKDGEVYMYHQFFTNEESDRLYHDFSINIQWKHEPINMFGKEVMQPRLTAWYGDEGRSYTYSGNTMNPQPWNDGLLFIKDRIEQMLGQKFNSALLNFYRDGNDSVGWHRDNEKSLGANPVIGSVSFGASRIFQLRHYEEKVLKMKILLEHGSVLLMTGQTQHRWEHSIPKEKSITEGRINITFRNIVS